MAKTDYEIPKGKEARGCWVSKGGREEINNI